MAEGFRGVGDAAPNLPGNGWQRGLPLIRPCGATFPRGKARVVVGGSGRSRRGGGTRPTDGDMETLWGLRGQPFPGRRAVGAGHARPGGWREHPSMVRPVGRGLDPSAGDCPGMAVGAKVSGASGTPPPTACPGMGGSGSLPLIRPCRATFPKGKARVVVGGDGRSRRGGGTRPTDGIWKRCGVYADTRSRAAAR